MAEQHNHNDVPAEGDFRLIAEVGNEHLEHGLTRIELRFDGRCVVINRCEGDEIDVEGHVDPQHAARLFKQATSEAFREARLGGGLGLPDEPRYRVEVHWGKEPMHTHYVWRSELTKHREVGGLVEALQEIVQKVTDGRVVL